MAKCFKQFTPLYFNISVPHVNSTFHHNNTSTLPNTNTSSDYIPSNLLMHGGVGNKQQQHHERHQINGTIMDDFFRQLNGSTSHMSNFTAPAALINMTTSSTHNRPLLNNSTQLYNGSTATNNNSTASHIKYGTTKNGTVTIPRLNGTQQLTTNSSRVNGTFSSIDSRNNNTASFNNRNDTFHRGIQSTLQGKRRTFFNRTHPTTDGAGNVRKSNIPHQTPNLREVSQTCI